MYRRRYFGKKPDESVYSQKQKTTVKVSRYSETILILRDLFDKFQLYFLLTEVVADV